MTYIRPCRKCGELFKPNAKFVRLCDKCNPRPHYRWSYDCEEPIKKEITNVKSEKTNDSKTMKKKDES